jgi:hypothetical protein
MANLSWPVLKSVYLYTCMVKKPLHIWMLFFRLPHPPLQAALPHSVYDSINLTLLEENSCMVKLQYIHILKSKGETCMVEEPSHVKELSLNHICKIGLRHSGFAAQCFWAFQNQPVFSKWCCHCWDPMGPPGSTQSIYLNVHVDFCRPDLTEATCYTFTISF